MVQGLPEIFYSFGNINIPFKIKALRNGKRWFKQISNIGVKGFIRTPI